MKYTIHRLDGRFTFHRYFDYYIGFGNRMSNQQGPLHFNTAIEWFTATYGWSAEARQWADIKQYIASPFYHATLVPELPDCVNPHWSWTNGYDDLRIYVASGQELSLFVLKFSGTA